MKKVFLILSLPFLLFSCSKNSSVDKPAPQAEAARKPITLNITGLRQSHEDFPAREDNAVKLSDVYYVIYSGNGTKLNYIHQDTVNNKETFGTIQDSLAPGVYTVALFAAESALYMEHVANYSNISSHSFAPQLTGMGVLPSGQIFYKKFQLEVKLDGNPPSIDVALDRIVGKLQIELFDALSQNTANGNLAMQIHPLAPFFSISESTALPPDDIWQYWGTRTSQTTFEDYFIGSDHEFTVTINYQDKNTGAFLTKTVEHVKCIANQKTIIRGYLYGDPQNPGGPGLQLRLNQSWSADSTVIPL